MQGAKRDEALSHDGFVLAGEEGGSRPEVVFDEAGDLIGALDAEVVEELLVSLASRDPEGDRVRCDRNQC